MSSTKILQPSCSPKKLTLLPTTGPRSRSRGCSREVSVCRNFGSAFVAKTGSTLREPDAGRCGRTSESLLRGARRSSSPIRFRSEKSDAQRAVPTSHSRLVLRAHALRSAGGRLRRRGRCGRLGFFLWRRRGGSLPLHVDAAAEVRAFGDRDPRRHDVAIHRSVVPNVHLVARGDVAGHLAEDDDRLGEYLSFDATVRTDR